MPSLFKDPYLVPSLGWIKLAAVLIFLNQFCPRMKLNPQPDDGHWLAAKCAGHHATVASAVTMGHGIFSCVYPYSSHFFICFILQIIY